MTDAHSWFYFKTKEQAEWHTEDPFRPIILLPYVINLADTDLMSTSFGFFHFSCTKGNYLANIGHQWSKQHLVRLTQCHSNGIFCISKWTLGLPKPI